MNKLLVIGTDRTLFKTASPLEKRVKEQAKLWSELYILIFTLRGFFLKKVDTNCEVIPTNSFSRWLYVFNAFLIGSRIIPTHHITHISCQDPFLTSVAGYFLKMRFKTVLEIQVHTDIGSPYFTFNIGNRVRKIMAMFFLKRADKVRVVSNRIADFINENVGINRDKIEIRPIFVDVDLIKKMPVSVDLHKKYHRFRHIILMASRLESEKNIEMAIDAWSRVVKYLPNAGLIIVGSGSCESSIKKKIHKNKLNDSIVLEPWNEEISSYYKTCDIFLITSLYEGYGMTMVEARAAGATLLSTDVGVAREVGAIIISLSPEDIADKIIKTLS